MFSIQKIFGRDQKFFDLLEASAQQADASVHHLIDLLERLEQKALPQSLEEFGGANHLGLDFHPARDRPTGICDGARRDCVVINA